MRFKLAGFIYSHYAMHFPLHYTVQVIAFYSFNLLLVHSHWASRGRIPLPYRGVLCAVSSVALKRKRFVFAFLLVIFVAVHWLTLVVRAFLVKLFGYSAFQTHILAWVKFKPIIAEVEEVIIMLI